MAKKTSSNVARGVAVGAGIAVLGAAAYLMFGPEGKKHRKDLKSWMVKMKGDVMEKMEDAKDLSSSVYEKILHEVEAKYKKMKNVDTAELAKEVAALKKNWRAVVAPVKKSVRKAASKAKKSSKKGK